MPALPTSLGIMRVEEETKPGRSFVGNHVRNPV